MPVSGGGLSCSGQNSLSHAFLSHFSHFASQGWRAGITLTVWSAREFCRLWNGVLMMPSARLKGGLNETGQAAGN